MKQFLFFKRKQKPILLHFPCLLLVFLTFITIPLHAQDGQRKINVQPEINTGSKLIESIKKQAPELRFTFDEAVNKKLNSPIKISGNEFSIQALMEILKKDLKVDYNITGDYIILKIITEPKKAKTESQNGNASVKGRIVEFETSQPLSGATVNISSIGRTIKSDEKGYYQIENLPAGNYDLEVSFVGFTTEHQQISLKANSQSTYDIRLQGSNAIEEIVVSSVIKTRAPVAHTSDKQLLSELKNMSVVASGISSQQISMSADRNAAETVQKIAGVSTVDEKFVLIRGLNPRYTLTYLNDNVAPSTEVNSRAFAMDLIPSRIIDKILVYKSPSPEFQGDATGGVIKIYTKDAKTVRHFDVELQLGWREGTTFNPDFFSYIGSSTDLLGFDNGTRALPKELPAYNSLQKAQLSPSKFAEIMNPTLTYSKATALPNMQLTANYYDVFRIRGKLLSSLTSFSYKNDFRKNFVERQESTIAEAFDNDKSGNDEQSIINAQFNLLQNFSYNLKPNHKLYFKNFILQQAADETFITQRWQTTAYQNWDFMKPHLQINRDITLSFRQRFLYAGNLGGNHDFGDEKKHSLQWNSGYTFSRQSVPDQRIIRMDNRDYWNNKTIMPDNWQAKIIQKTGGTGDGLDLVPRIRGIISRTWQRNSEGVYNANLDYSYKINPSIKAKIGTFQQWKDRQLYRRVYTMHEAAIDDVNNPHSLYFHSKNIKELTGFYANELQHIWSPEYLNDNMNGLAVHDRTKGSDSYIATEQNNAGYILFDYSPANAFLEIHAGLRYEFNRQKIGAAIAPTLGFGTGGGVNSPILIDNPMHTWLPSVNVALRPNENWTFRVAYGNTLNRTEFREVSPYEEIDFESNTLIRGNPSLLAAKSTNYDARLEFYPRAKKGTDMISVGVFYKNLTNPIERIMTSSRVNSSFNMITFQNATQASLKGLEIEVRQSLDFIPLDFMRNFSVIGNVSLIQSLVKFDTLTFPDSKITDRSLQGQAPYLINAGLYYDNADWGSKIAILYNTKGETIYAASQGEKFNDFLNVNEYRGSIIELPRQLLDISYTQRIGKAFQGKLAVQNLLNQEIRMAEDINFSNKYEPLNETYTEDEYGKKTFTAEGDNIFSSFKPGRFINLSFSYSF